METNKSLPWSPESYPHNSGESAAKLASSAVAPLVAAARGYTTITDNKAWRQMAEIHNLPKTGQLARKATEGGVLMMPWYTAADIQHAKRTRKTAIPANMQMRPANPGKLGKYLFRKGVRSVLDVHPAVPIDWHTKAPTILIAEGLLKGDAALTGYLLDRGIKPADLEWDNDNSEEARTHLHRILDATPSDDWLLILTMGGSGNWHSNPEWNTFDLRDTEVWLGFDADVSKNPHVWKQAIDLHSFAKGRHAEPVKILSLPTSDGDAQGIDDFLAHSTFRELKTHLSEDLPPPPPNNNLALVGTYRIAPDGAKLQECRPVKDEFGMVVDGKWEVVANVGGRIVSYNATRTPTTGEIVTGVFGTGVEVLDDYVAEIEIGWTNQDGSIQKETWTVPSDYLSTPPSRWTKIPLAITASSAWPPPFKLGEQWLWAVKAHREDETVHKTNWGSMGWVPVDGNAMPVFAFSGFAIGDEDLGADSNATFGVTTDVLRLADSFGVGPIDTRPFDDPDYKAQVRADIEKVIKTMILDEPWTDRGTAAAVLAAGLRPALPVRPRTTIYLEGAPGKGKSWTASVIMGFWSREPGDFNASNLPGSVKDTPTAMELAVSRAPVWVVDDLAPGSHSSVVRSEYSKVADLIRNVYNNTGKQRSNIDLEVRKTHLPNALLVVTAENELGIPSAMQRCFILDIGYGALNPSSDPTDAVTQLCVEDGAPARVSQAMIRFVREVVASSPRYADWGEFYQAMLGGVKAMEDTANTVMKEQFGIRYPEKRQRENAADLLISLQWLAMLANEVGVPADLIKMLAGLEDSAIVDLIGVIARGHLRHQAHTPGRSILEAVRAALSQGAGHITDITNPADPPAVDNNTLTALGYKFRDGTPEPQGAAIGMFYTSDEGHDVVLLDRQTAFTIAQRNYPELVPTGQKIRSSWDAFFGEQLHVEELREYRGDKPRNTGRITINRKSIRGIPVHLDTLLGYDEGIDDEEDD